MKIIDKFFKDKISKMHQQRLNEHGLTRLEEKMMSHLLIAGCFDEMTSREARPIIKKLSEIIKNHD